MIDLSSQRTMILSWLKRKSITPQDAMNFGCYRLAARIHDLRRSGHNIITVMEPHDGGKHARYFLRERQK